MTNSTTAGARVHITAEYLSEDEPLELLLFHYVKSSRNRISAPGEGRHMRMPTLNEIESQTDQPDGNRLEKPCKMVGQKSDKAKCKSLKRELLNCEGKVLQNLNSRVRFSPAPPTPSTDERCCATALLNAKVCKDPSESTTLVTSCLIQRRDFQDWSVLGKHIASPENDPGVWREDGVNRQLTCSNAWCQGCR